MPISKLTKRYIDGLGLPKKREIHWDTELKGFGLSVTPNGNRSYVVQYRLPGGRRGRTRRMTIGRHGSPWTVDEARKKARSLLAAASIGEDPAGAKQDAKKDFTVSELCDLYLEEGTALKKSSTIATDNGRIERHIKPLLGKRRLSEVKKTDIEAFLRDVANGKTKADIRTGLRGRAIVQGGKGTASRTLGLLGGIFSFALDRDLMAENPATGVKRYSDAKRERFLSDQELRRLGKALAESVENGDPREAVDIIRLLTLTGCRYSEIAALKWQEINFEHACLYLGDSKTGQKVVILNAPALNELSARKRREGSEFVFPAKKGNGGHYQGTPKVWTRIRARADLDDVRLHDLRHTFASVGAASGLSLPLIGALLGHKDSATTARYSHIAEDPIRRASDSIGRRIVNSLGQPDNGAEVIKIIRNH